MLDTVAACPTCGARRYQKAPPVLQHSSPLPLPPAAAEQAAVSAPVTPTSVAPSRIRRVAQLVIAVAGMSLLAGYFLTSHEPHHPQPERALASPVAGPQSPEDYAVALQQLGADVTEAVRSVEYWCDRDAFPSRPRTRCKDAVEQAAALLNKAKPGLARRANRPGLDACLGEPIGLLRDVVFPYDERALSGELSDDQFAQANAFSTLRMMDSELDEFPTKFHEGIEMCRALGVIP